MVTLDAKYGIFTTDAPQGSVFRIGDRVHARGLAESRYGRVAQFYVRKSPQVGFLYVLADGGMFAGSELESAR